MGGSFSQGKGFRAPSRRGSNAELNLSSVDRPQSFARVALSSIAVPEEVSATPAQRRLAPTFATWNQLSPTAAPDLELRLARQYEGVRTRLEELERQVAELTRERHIPPEQTVPPLDSESEKRERELPSVLSDSEDRRESPGRRRAIAKGRTLPREAGSATSKRRGAARTG